MKTLPKYKVSKVGNKLKREFLRLPLVSDFNEGVYRKRLAEYKPSLPTISAQDQEVVHALTQQGRFSTDLSSLYLPKTAEAIQQAKDLLADPSCCKGDENKNWIPAEILNGQEDLLLWGVDERLLDIVENYVGLPVYYLGVEVRQEFPDGQAAGVRQWHIDTEDHRMMKIIIYLNDVDEKGGPFECISKDLTQKAAKKLRYNSGLVSDKIMSEVVPPSSWITCVGSENTAIFIDPCSIFHRAKPPIDKERLSITFHYISQYPLEFRSDNIFSDQPFIHEKLSARQLKCLM